MADTLTVDTFLSSGTWTAPSGVTSAVVECWGAGGGGTTNVGGGGGGAYSKSTVVVVPTVGYDVVVGTSAANTDGGDSTFASIVVVAKGGLSGTNGGTGGAAASGTGDTKYSGGNGYIAVGNTSGGGGAGDSGNGNDGVGSTTSGGETNGGYALLSGNGGLNAAGGGSTATTQFAGARGEVRITYDIAGTALYPNIISRSWGRENTNTASHTITMPSGIVAGNKLVCVFGVDANPTCSDGSATWTKLGQASNGTASTQAIFYKVAAGGDTLTVTTTASENSSYVVFNIANAGTPDMTQANGSSTNADPPSHTPAGGSAK
jgi:hypothetical protein